MTAALIYVGLLMMAYIRNVDWNNLRFSVPAFFVLVIMLFTYNISYIVICCFCGDAKKIKGSSWVIALLFVAMLLTH